MYSSLLIFFSSKPILLLIPSNVFFISYIIILPSRCLIWVFLSLLSLYLTCSVWFFSSFKNICNIVITVSMSLPANSKDGLLHAGGLSMTGGVWKENMGTICGMRTLVQFCCLVSGGEGWVGGYLWTSDRVDSTLSWVGGGVGGDRCD